MTQDETGTRRPRARRELPRVLAELGPQMVDDGRYAESLPPLDEILRKTAAKSDSSAEAVVVAASLVRCFALSKMGQRDAALASLDELVDHHGGSRDRGVLVVVADALQHKRNVLHAAGFGREGMAVDEELVRRFGAAIEAEFREATAFALAGWSYRLLYERRVDEAVAVSDQLVERNEEETDLELQRSVGELMLAHAQALVTLQLGQEKLWLRIAANLVIMPAVLVQERLRRRATKGCLNESTRRSTGLLGQQTSFLRRRMDAQRQRCTQALKVTRLLLARTQGDDIELSQQEETARQYQRVAHLGLGRI